MAGTVALIVSGARQGTNLIAGWYGFLGVSYRLYSSMNLVDWLPHGEPFTGGNAPMQVPLPLDGGLEKILPRPRDPLNPQTVRNIRPRCRGSFRLTLKIQNETVESVQHTNPKTS